MCVSASWFFRKHTFTLSWAVDMYIKAIDDLNLIFYIAFESSFAFSRSCYESAPNSFKVWRRAKTRVWVVNSCSDLPIFYEGTQCTEWNFVRCLRRGNFGVLMLELSVLIFFFRVCCVGKTLLCFWWKMLLSSNRGRGTRVQRGWVQRTVA